MAGKPLTLMLPIALGEKSEIDRALDLYTRGSLSFGAAAEQAGVSCSELSRHAHARGLEPPFSAVTLAEELGWMEQLRRDS